MDSYYVYILQSSKDEKFYIGFTKDIYERLKRHNCGKVFSTKNRLPFKLIYSERADTLQKALLREKYLKQLKRERLRQLIESRGGCSSAG